MAASGKTYLRNAANDAWISVAVGSGSSGGSGTSFDTNFMGTMSGDQTIGNGAWTKILFDTATIDDNSEFDSANDYWVAQEDGVYLIRSSARYVANSTGIRGIMVYINGAGIDRSVINMANSGGSITTRPFTVIAVQLSLGDYVEIYTYQNSGGNLNVVASITPGDFSSTVTIHRIH